MEHEKLKKILQEHYAESSVYSILSGNKRPGYIKMYLMNKEHGVPFNAWLNIKKYLEEEENTSLSKATA